MAATMAIDTGGTFTDLVLDPGDGSLVTTKAPTTAAAPVEGMLAAVDVAAARTGESRRSLLARTERLTHATTHFLNAVITGRTARTALLTSAGHPDVLVYGEGGRADTFDYTLPGRRPYVPRSLTFEVPGRIGADGEVRRELERDPLLATIEELRAAEVEAVAVCLLFSPLHPTHEEEVGEMLTALLPDVPFTLSHRLNPVLREYRRASSAAIDASLKPLAARYLADLTARLGAEGFEGRLQIVTSAGGVVEPEEILLAPVRVLNSGPSMAPVAGRAAAAAAGLGAEDIVVTDAGGTTFDVSVVRGGRISRTRELYLGRRYLSPLVGLPSLDISSVGAGGGSIAWVDPGGVLQVGPQSAGAEPGPACYGAGGLEPTVTDAALLLGFIDREGFLGGRMRLRADLAAEAMSAAVAAPLAISVDEAAAAVMALVAEQMVLAIEEIALRQGVATEGALLVAGGGAGGLNAVAIARRLGARRVLVPPTSPVLSAAGALGSDLVAEFARARPSRSDRFDAAGVAATLAELAASADAFLADNDARGGGAVEYFVEARYPQQAWDLELPLRREASAGDDLARAFHRLHAETFAVADESSPVEFTVWHARARCHGRGLGGQEPVAVAAPAAPAEETGLPVFRLERLRSGEEVEGPAILRSDYATVVLEPASVARRLADGAVLVEVGSEGRGG